ncbi:TIGR03089 family protein [Brachybacterium sp. Marseille-Q7125]|uniref:TIGR03089 family protein n=1 Tax=Brachybacterium sp. Marseille-Q7125 TaxID=2932815 RepID=UPI001FF4EEE0|nr:TIGR03089 family protein [Brachybacterium sp. Marseille-Q7125]
MTAPADPTRTAHALLDALQAQGPQPVLAWYGEAARVELSGHVLANWIIKAIGHLADEIALAPGAAVLIDLPPHWKRLVLAIAAWSLGADVTLREPAQDGAAPEPSGGVDAPAVLVTDVPQDELADAADEVLALEARSLAPRFDSALPPLVHDWVQEVRAHPDQLSVPLPAWSGPAPSAPGDGIPRLLVPGDGLDVITPVLGAWLAGGGIICPADQVSAAQARNEGATGHA